MQSRLLFVNFWLFQTNNTIVTTNVCSSSIRYWDLNPLSLEYETSPTAGGPRLRPPTIRIYLVFDKVYHFLLFSILLQLGRVHTVRFMP